ncbi:MAG: hypothetical protein MUF84_07170 [Anaerolineae bacterium]|nr:hypothetical protein [Anaerolineae bacterium]
MPRASAVVRGVAFSPADGTLRPMPSTNRTWARWTSVLGVLLCACLVLGRSDLPAQDMEATLDLVSARRTFNFFTWEARALASKAAYGLLAAERYMDDEAQSRFVLAYLDDVRESDRLSSEIDRIYADAEIEDPDMASQTVRAAYAMLRADMARRAPIAEAILESQVSQALADGALGVLASILPPVSGTFTPLPTILVISPRDRIESISQRQLVAGLTAAEQNTMEELVMEALPDVSAYVTEIGGLAAYPAMLLETGSISWVTDVVAHEWVHHYLTFHPLGWEYMRSSEARTINETTASLIGEWAGQQLMLRYYEPLLVQDKALPELLKRVEEADGGTASGFDFRAEMHHTRVVVDGLLAEGKVSEAEWYMEAQRRYFAANGYRIRRLNQAYFAFHGAYASTPGATGTDPIGPLVRRLWAISDSPADFLRRVAPIASLDALQSAVQHAEALSRGASVEVRSAYGIISGILHDS